jgi:uncharacterized protein YbgA (DUF1722 family)/uncharacterized protein YbbK (DUF523 family)
MEKIMSKIKIGISSCLLGNKVRYDGQHKFDHFLAETLGAFMDYIPVCPEVECGLPVPRDAMRLVGDPENPRLVTIKTKTDFTDQMKSWGAKKLDELASENLCGFIFKAKSPSSGMERIKIYPIAGGVAQKNGTGIFADMFMKKFPHLPVEDDGRLHDPEIRENFIERVFAYKRWIEMIENEDTVHGLIQFHSKHKLMLMAHSPEHYRFAGQITASGDKNNLKSRQSDYLRNMMEGLKKSATLKKNFNVLQHILGYFKNELTSDEKKETLEIMENYKNGLIPLIVPVTLLNHYINKYNQEYLKEQYYLHPHPYELKLRNHA